MRLSVRPIIPLLLCLTCVVAGVSAKGHAAKPFELLDGDRVVFVGNTFFERAIDYGYIELELTTRWPDRSITFRNLGWSGDDSRGRSRRFFGPVEDGFNHLKTHVEDLKPTVIFVSYGAMESFEGRDGLDDFNQNMKHLLDTLDKTKARIALVSTIPQENMGAPMPDPSRNNKNLKLYANALEAIANKRNYYFVNLFDSIETAMKSSESPLTDNGVHLNDAGYQVAAKAFVKGMGLSAIDKSISIDGRGKLLGSEGITVLRIDAMAGGNQIMASFQPNRLSSGALRLSVSDLFSGDYSLRIGGRELGPFSANEWSDGVEIPWTPASDQEALLLDTIRIKNELYFHQWRPQNETYLRGFRKHEQGQNAAELDEFDAYIESEEGKINDLKTPRRFMTQLQRNPKN